MAPAAGEEATIVRNGSGAVHVRCDEVREGGGVTERCRPSPRFNYGVTAFNQLGITCFSMKLEFLGGQRGRRLWCDNVRGRNDENSCLFSSSEGIRTSFNGVRPTLWCVI